MIDSGGSLENQTAVGEGSGISSLLPGKVQSPSTLTSSSGGVGGGLEMGCARSVDGDKQARPRVACVTEVLRWV